MTGRRIVGELSGLRLLVCDIDGVMTDGGIILDTLGNELKRFNVRDGSGLVYWQRVGHQVRSEERRVGK